MKIQIIRFFSHVTFGKLRKRLRCRYKSLRSRTIEKRLDSISHRLDDIHAISNFVKGKISSYDTALNCQLIRSNVNNISTKVRQKRSIVFVHSLNFNNTGDVNCAPYKYFRDYWKYSDCAVINLNSPMINDIKSDDIVILGGGGLIDFSEEWNVNINRILSLSKNVICWSMGSNTHYDSKKPLTSVNFNKFSLIGIRDFGNELNLPYLPCVSCMSALLSKQYGIKRDVGIIEHQDFPIKLDYERINNKVNIEEMITFIGESEKIITNGYHALYWATLMGKGVVLYKPFSTRYDHFKFLPVIYSGNIKKDLQSVVCYQNALQESRDLNIQFFERVKNIISI